MDTSQMSKSDNPNGTLILNDTFVSHEQDSID